jgi:Putative mono-oxygenase ydhR
MSLMILQIDFVDTRARSADETATLIPLAQQIKNTPGLIWKIWTENPATQEAGGIYLFENDAALEDYRLMHIERLKQMGIEQINVKKFQVNEKLTQITKGEHCLRGEPN